MTIWKFPLDIVDQQTVQIPKNAKALSVAVQGEHLMLWALGNPSEPLEGRRVRIVGTGHIVESGIGHFLGTVVMPPFVWHVFVEPAVTVELLDGP